MDINYSRPHTELLFLFHSYLFLIFYFFLLFSFIHSFIWCISLPCYCCTPYIFLPLLSLSCTRPPWDRFLHRLHTSHFTCLPPLFWFLLLLICLFTFLFYLSLYFPPLLLLYSIRVFPSVLADRSSTLSPSAPPLP